MDVPTLSNDGCVSVCPPSGDGEKKILIHYTALNRGGAELSLVRLMSGLVKRGCEVHLVLTVSGGKLEDSIDPRVVVHHLRTTGTGVVTQKAGRRWLAGIPVVLVRSLLGRFQEWRAFSRFRRMRFDAAFVGRAGMSYSFVCNVVDARRRFVFVRSDPSVTQNQRWGRMIARFEDRVDHYVCVSAFVQKEMAKCFPRISSKLSTVYNLIEPDRIRELATGSSNPFEGQEEELRILSVCRLHEAPKGLLRMVEVHRQLLQAGLPHTWHVLGDGPDRGLLERFIEAHDATRTFILHGDVANPFPYYKHADICAVLSRYEGLCGVVNEARVLERPVVATRFSGIEEQIENGVNGVIVEQDVDSICTGLASLIRDPALRERLARGGYPQVLLNDELKLDAILKLITDAPSAAASLR